MSTRFTREDGYLGPAMAVMLFCLILTAGFAIDLSGQMRAMQRADDVAREAGRQGAQALDVTQAMSGQAQSIDPVQARAVAQNYLTTAGVQGEVTILAGGTQLEVTTTTSYEPMLLGIIGITQLKADGHARVELVRVIAGQER